MKEKSIKWLKATGIRVVKTIAEAAIALIPAGITIEAVDWRVVASSALLAGFVCFLTCLKGLPEVQED